MGGVPLMLLRVARAREINGEPPLSCTVRLFAATEPGEKNRKSPQAAQNGLPSHPPSPGAPRRAVPRTRPQRARATYLFVRCASEQCTWRLS